MSNKSTRSSPKVEIGNLARQYSGAEKKIIYNNNGAKTAYVSKTIENCHPRLNGYRENIVFSDANGQSLAQKIVVHCTRCTEVHHKLKPK